jgi:chromosome segregation ATPase
MQLEASLKSSQAEARSQREIIVELSQRADEAATERKRADGLAAALASVSASLEQAEQRLASLDTTATDAAATLAEMLDKNLALEAELSRLREQQRQAAQERSHSEIEVAEQLRLVQETAAHQEAQFASTLAAARTDQAQRVAALEGALADERAARAQGERQLREELAAAAQQTAQSEQAKRRVLSILQQEKVVVGEMQTELERLHLEHTTALEQHEAMQKMLATAEDRIDDQKTQIADLYEENKVLRNELVEKEQHLAKLQTPSAGARAGEPPRTLADAQLTIRQLRADLRLRGDLVEKLTADVDAEAAAQAALRERNEEVAVLQNELTMALGEASRLRQRLETQPRVTPRDLVMLRERIDGLEDRILAKEKEIAILRTAANDDIDGSPLRDHVTGLERDQEASIAVVRFLEGEVKKLSAELRPTGVV